MHEVYVDLLKNAGLASLVARRTNGVLSSICILRPGESAGFGRFEKCVKQKFENIVPIWMNDRLTEFYGALWIEFVLDEFTSWVEGPWSIPMLEFCPDRAEVLYFSFKLPEDAIRFKLKWGYDYA